MIIFLSGAIMTEKNVEEAIKDGAMVLREKSTSQTARAAGILTSSQLKIVLVMKRQFGLT
jgi:hypothetical protein